MQLNTDAEDSPVHLKFDDIGPNAAALLPISELVCWILSQQLNIASPDNIAQCDWQICRA